MDTDIPLLDDSIVKLPADFRQDLANRILSNLYVFSKAVMGFKDMTVKMHGPVCEYLDHNSSKIKAVGQPRETFKSSIATIAYNLREVTRDPNTTRVIINEKLENAQGFLRVIRDTVEANKIYRTLWSGVVPKDFRKVIWNDSELEFNRTVSSPQATITARGLFSALASQHYHHIQYDDIISNEAAESAEVMKKSTARALQFRPLMRNPSEATMLVVFTHWAFHDTYTVLFERIGNGMSKLIRGAIEDGELTFPERLSHEMLAQLRSELGDYLFSCLYMNNPRDESVQDFNTKDLKYCQVDYDRQLVRLYNRDGQVFRVWLFSQLDITATVDFAAAEKNTSDRNAVSVVGVSPDNEMISLENWAERCTPLRLMEQLFLFHRIYTPRVWGLEDVQYQAAYKYFVGDYATREGIYLNVRPIKSIKRKETRIRGLQPVAASGRLFVGAAQSFLRQEMADFPLGQFDDCLDALSMQLQVMSNQMNGKRWQRYLHSEKKILAEIEFQRRLSAGGIFLPKGSIDEDDLLEDYPQQWQEVELTELTT